MRLPPAGSRTAPSEVCHSNPLIPSSNASVLTCGRLGSSTRAQIPARVIACLPGTSRSQHTGNVACTPVDSSRIFLDFQDWSHDYVQQLANNRCKIARMTPTSPCSVAPSTAKHPGSDPLSRPARLWSGKKGTTAEAQFIRQVRAQLVHHVGGKPSAVERIMIERAVMLTVHLGRMDAEALAGGGMSDHARKQYLAWDGKLRQALRQIGKAAPERVTSLAEYLAAKAAAAPASAAPAAPAAGPAPAPCPDARAAQAPAVAAAGGP